MTRAASHEADVVVVGAGPAGSASAALLARAGLRVDLFERAAFPRDTVCGEFVSGEGVAVLARLGAMARLSGAPRVERVRLHAASGRCAAAPLPSIQGESSRAIRRSLLDAALKDVAAESGARVHSETRVVGLRRNEAGAVAGVVATDARGRDLSVAAAITVGADGKGSIVARETGAFATGPRPEKWAGFAAHVATGAAAADDAALDLYFYPGGYGGILGLGHGVANLCGLVLATALPPSRDARSLFEATFLSNPAARERLRGVPPPTEWRTTGALPLGRRVAAGFGYVLVGDAAGMIDPFTGDGIAMALSGAEILAAAVAASRLAGDFPRGAERRYARGARETFFRRRATSRLLRAAARLPRLGEAAIALSSRAAPVLDAWIRWTRG